MACNILQHRELSSSTSNMILCALKIGQNSVLKNIGGTTAPPAPSASWGLNTSKVVSVLHYLLGSLMNKLYKNAKQGGVGKICNFARRVWSVNLVEIFRFEVSHQLSIPVPCS